MKKIYRWVTATGALGLGLVLASSVVAAPLNYSADTTIALTSPALNWTVLSGSTATAVVINAGSVAVTINPGETFTMTSADSDVTISGVVIGVSSSVACNSSRVATATIAASTSSGVFTLTPTGAKCTLVVG